MYSWEIKELLELKQFLLEYQEYIEIIKTSPQINYVEYLAQGDKIHITTEDRFDFQFKVKPINGKERRR